jgi:hypothetical protein
MAMGPSGARCRLFAGSKPLLLLFLSREIFECAFCASSVPRVYRGQRRSFTGSRLSGEQFIRVVNLREERFMEGLRSETAETKFSSR